MKTNCIEVINGAITAPTLDVYRNHLKGFLKDAKNGFYKLPKYVRQYQERYKVPTRYKYYFDHICYLILLIDEFHDDYTGQPVKTTLEVHEALKVVFNAKKIHCKSRNEILIIGRSTKELSDYDFIQNYEEPIMAAHADKLAIYDVQFLAFEEYCKHHEDRTYDTYKKYTEALIEFKGLKIKQQ